MSDIVRFRGANIVSPPFTTSNSMYYVIQISSQFKLKMIAA